MPADSYYSWMVLIATVSAVVALSSAVFGVYTQARAWREASKPNLIAFIRPRSGEVAIMDLTVANIGRGAAQQVRLKSFFATEVDENKLTTANIWVPGKNGLTEIPWMLGGTEVSQPFGVSWQLIRIPEIWPLTLTLEYSDKSGGAQKSVSFRLDPGPFVKFHQLGKPPINAIADSLGKIERTLSELKSWSGLRVDAVVETLGDRNARMEKEREEFIASREPNGATREQDTN